MLALDASTVSQFISGKRAPSRKALLRICDTLSPSPAEQRQLGLAEAAAAADEFYTLTADSFAVMADWYHFAILELTFVQNFRADAKWIARQLGLSVSETKIALERLARLGLLEKKGNRLVKTRASLTNHTGPETSAARKNLQRQILEKALHAIDETTPAEKDITSITMAIDPQNLDKARELTKKFRRDLCALLEEGKPSRVYNLGVQLYPISKGN